MPAHWTRATHWGPSSSDEVSSRVKELSDGRLIRIIRKPMQGDGWVAIHEDITERHQIEKQRDEMLVHENRRSLTEAAISMFRDRIDEVLNTVSNNAYTMKSTAAALLDSSDQTTQHAEGALRESNAASANVAKVAGSAAARLAWGARSETCAPRSRNSSARSQSDVTCTSTKRRWRHGCFPAARP
jgi:hypothetical protein